MSDFGGSIEPTVEPKLECPVCSGSGKRTLPCLACSECQGTGQVANPAFTAFESTKAVARKQTRFLNVGADASPGRKVVANCIGKPSFDLFMAIVICFNIILMILETDRAAACLSRDDLLCAVDSTGTWLHAADHFLLAIYFLEAGARLYAVQGRFFYNRWNNLDLGLVVIGLLDVIITSVFGDEVLPNLQMFRALRICRLVRAARVLTVIHELYLLIGGFASAMKSMFWGFVMMVMLLMICSILAVKLVHPVSMTIDYGGTYGGDEWCREAFSSVLLSFLLFFQTVVAGDSWGFCALSVITEAPQLFPLFAGVLFTIQVGFLNLILAVIVDRAAQAREDDHKQKLFEKRQAEMSAETTLLSICETIDADKSGDMTRSEVLHAFDNNDTFAKQLELMNIDRETLDDVFKCMDKDGSGTVSYAEFITNLRKGRTQDVRLLIVDMRMQLETMKYQMLHAVTTLSDKVNEMAARSEEAVPAVGYMFGGAGPCRQVEPNSSLKEARSDVSNADVDLVCPMLPRLEPLHPYVSPFVPATPSNSFEPIEELLAIAERLTHFGEEHVNVLVQESNELHRLVASLVSNIDVNKAEEIAKGADEKVLPLPGRNSRNAISSVIYSRAAAARRLEPSRSASTGSPGTGLSSWS